MKLYADGGVNVEVVKIFFGPEKIFHVYQTCWYEDLEDM